MNPKVDTYLSEVKKWPNELEKLRSIILDCGLTEDFKWRSPCYSFNGSNIVLIGGFKEYCMISFVKGALLGDPNKVLFQQTENVQSARIIKFTKVAEIEKLEATIKTYIFEAIAVEKSGLKVPEKTVAAFDTPEELEEKFAANPAFEKAFKALTPGRQKGYLLYFAGAKQAKTRADRIDNFTQQIMDGFGFRDCTCGLSKRKPNCDGSHRQLA
jgi:uncharacterized protein YdeI (YjbR/CyaY-like superfamily)